MHAEYLGPLKNRFGLLIAATALGLLVGCADAGVKTGRYVDDSTITTKVKSELVTTKGIHSTSVHVETSNGVVFLSGFVPTAEEKKRAVEIAYSVEGVKSVKDGLDVRQQ